MRHVLWQKRSKHFKPFSTLHFLDSLPINYPAEFQRKQELTFSIPKAIDSLFFPFNLEIWQLFDFQETRHHVKISCQKRYMATNLLHLLW